MHIQIRKIYSMKLNPFSEKTGLGQNVKMFLCQRYTDEKLKDIGAYFGVGESGVSQACRRVKDKTRKDKKLE
ncbi:MAG: hypothetical protein U9Q97_02635, partial [Acidobacteriota bacterium]|nr:hypothetical protein [Acidobacteriota bacterium]